MVALLVLGVLGAVTRFTDMGDRLGTTTRDRHRRAVLSRLLWQDLNHRPVGEPSPEGTERRFERTTVSYESERLLRLDTRVRYVVRERGGSQQLDRRWKWVDLQEDFQEGETLLRAPRIRFSYRDAEGRWVSSTREAGRMTAFRLEWGQEPDQRIVVPVMVDDVPAPSGDTLSAR